MEIQHRKIQYNIIKDFDCGNTSINQQIKNSPYINALNLASAYEIKIGNRVVGYYMYHIINIRYKDLAGDISEYYDERFTSITSFYIDYIAIDKKYQRKGLGTVVLRDIMKELTKKGKVLPIKAISFDTFDYLVKWYEKNGFVETVGVSRSSVMTNFMFLDLMGKSQYDEIDNIFGEESDFN